MIPVDQTKFGAPDGNCLMACVASIIERPLAELPDLSEEEAKRPKTTHWWDTFTQVMEALGYSPRYFPADEGWAPKGYAVARGRSPRLPEFPHAVVVLDGKQVHDPHWSREGVLPQTIEGYYALIPLVRVE